jgi:predicted transposase/invertase (TIGR01784 family)
VGIAARVANGEELSTKDYNTLRGYLRDSPRDYRALFADLAGRPEWGLNLTEMKNGVPDTPLSAPRPERPDDMNVKNRERLAEAIEDADPELARGIRDGTIAYDDPRIRAFEQGLEAGIKKADAAVAAAEAAMAEDARKFKGAVQGRALELYREFKEAEEKHRARTTDLAKKIRRGEALAGRYQEEEARLRADSETARADFIEHTALLPDNPGGKKSILDVRARLADGTRINIEVQLLNEYNIAQRTLYYWARQYGRSIEAGQDYRVLPKVIVISILGFRNRVSERYHTSYHLREDTEPELVLTDNLELHFYDMPRFREAAGKDIRGNAEHRWLRYLDRQTPEEEVEELIKMDAGIGKAQERMEAISRDEGLLRAYELYEMALSDETSMLNGARDEEKVRIAGNLKAMGMPAERIAEATGLDMTSITAL